MLAEINALKWGKLSKRYQCKRNLVHLPSILGAQIAKGYGRSCQQANHMRESMLEKANGSVSGRKS